MCFLDKRQIEEEEAQEQICPENLEKKASGCAAVRLLQRVFLMNISTVLDWWISTHCCFKDVLLRKKNETEPCRVQNAGVVGVSCHLSEMERVFLAVPIVSDEGQRLDRLLFDHTLYSTERRHEQ